MIGSIGVKGQSWFVYNDPVSIKSDFFGPNISTLKGIDYYQPYSGESKDIFNPFRKPTTKEINKIQEMLYSIYEKFVNIISKFTFIIILWHYLFFFVFHFVPSLHLPCN